MHNTTSPHNLNFDA